MTNLEKSRQKFVSDEYIGELYFCDNKWKYNDHPDYFKKFIYPHEINTDKYHIISVILESPHKEEFKNIDLTTNTNQKVNARPLNNPKSKQALIHILENITENFYKKEIIYKIVLINAVQFQTSLGLENKDIRNENWIKNWIDYKDDLISRIKNVKPLLIFNFCTQGSYKKDNGEFQEIDENYLKKIGLKFTKENENVLFEVRRSFGGEKFTLQEMVEFELEKSELITNNNYTKYFHPSKFTFKNIQYTNLEIKHKINFCTSTIKITNLTE